MTGSSGTVLVVDDDSGLRSLYRCWLSSSYEVQTAADGVGALQQLDETVGVVLLDREMPNKDGIAVARELERMDIDPVVVMISGVEPGPELLDIPVDDYLEKPVSGETVVERVRRAAAATECQPRQRRLVALDTRRRIVEATVPDHRLADDSRYQRAVDRIEADGSVLEQARAAVPVTPDHVAADGGRTLPDSSR